MVWTSTEGLQIALLYRLLGPRAHLPLIRQASWLQHRKTPFPWGTVSNLQHPAPRTSACEPPSTSPWPQYHSDCPPVMEPDHAWILERGKHRIGSPNKIIRIHKSKFGHHKHSTGASTEKWVFGVGHKLGHTFLIPITDHSTETLMGVISHWIEPILPSCDCSEAYHGLDEHGNNHETINHILGCL